VSRGRPPGASRALVAILVAAALSRFVFGVWVVGLGAPIRGDEADYHAIATHLTAGDGFTSTGATPTARRPPAYPVFLSLLYRLGGPDPAAGRVAQVLLGVAVVWLTMLATRRWFGATAGLVAGAFAAFNPFLIFTSGYLLTENLYLVLLLSALVIAPTPRAIGTGSPPRAAATGALLGLAALSRPTGVPMLEWLLAAGLLFGAGPWPRRLGRLGLALAAFLVVVTPWLSRNARVMGGWVLTTHGGITFYQGNNAKVAHTPQWHGGAAPLDALPRIDELVTMDELSRDRLAWQLGREYLRDNPGDVPGLVGWKLARFWRVKSDMGLSGIRSGWWFNRESVLGRVAAGVDVGMVYALVSLPLFALGLVATRGRWRDLLIAYGVIAVHTMVAVVFFGSLRTRIPIEPVICAFAAAALVTGFDRFRRRAQPRPAGA
jgi:4-amino-4-deoxy-L-arabinose transferase-like glycosyltransferase